MAPDKDAAFGARGGTPPGPSARGRRRRGPWVVLAWLVLCVATVATGRVHFAAGSGLYDHLPAEHRPALDEHWLFLTLPEGAGRDAAEAAEAAVAGALGDRLVPLWPPLSDLAAFRREHLLFFLGPEDRAVLDARTRPEAIRDAVDGIRDWMASPAFGVLASRLRRDPLGLDARLAAPTPVAGRLRGVRPTSRGNLVSEDGRHLLLRLRAQQAPAELLARVRRALPEDGVRAAILGRRAFEDRVSTRLRRRAARTLAIAACIWVATLSLAIRRARTVLVLVGCLSITAVAVLPLVGKLDLWSVPAVLFAMAFSAEAGLPAWRRRGGWAVSAVLVAAALPLALSSSPALSAVALRYAAASLLLGAALRFVLPALLDLAGGPTVWPKGGVRVVPLPAFAFLCTGVLLAAGAAAVHRMQVVAPDQLARKHVKSTDDERAMARVFFDPARLVRTETSGADLASALDDASAVAAPLSELVPSKADLVVAPGRLVVRADEAERARAALQELDLGGRLALLRKELADAGFRPDAFGAFLSLDRTLSSPPTAERVLAGPLGPWIERQVVRDDPLVRLPSFVLLSPDPSVLPRGLLDRLGRPIRLVGPAVFFRRGLRHFDDWLGMMAVIQLWIAALLVWVATRKLTVSLGSALTGLATQAAVLGSMDLLGLPAGIHLAFPLLLVGASATATAARAMEARALGEPIAPELPLVTGTFQAGAGLALLATGQPLWAHQGAVVVIGAAVTWGAGLLLAPGLHLLLLRLRRRT